MERGYVAFACRYYRGMCVVRQGAGCRYCFKITTHSNIGSANEGAATVHKLEGLLMRPFLFVNFNKL